MIDELQQENIKLKQKIQHIAVQANIYITGLQEVVKSLEDKNKNQIQHDGGSGRIEILSVFCNYCGHENPVPHDKNCSNCNKSLYHFEASNGQKNL